MKMTLSPARGFILLLILSFVDAGEPLVQFEHVCLLFPVFFFFYSNWDSRGNRWARWLRRKTFLFFITVFVKCEREEIEEGKKNRLYLCQQIPSEAADAGWCSENTSGVAVTLLPRVEYMQTFANTMAEFLEVVLASQYCVEASRWVTSTCLASLISNKYLSTDWVLLPFSPLTPFSLY